MTRPRTPGHTPWHGSAVRKARAHWATRLPVACCRCGQPVIPDPTKPHDGWQVDHYPIPRELGGTDTWPAHATCNQEAGARRGAQITNARRAATQPTAGLPPETDRNIRGW